MAYEFYKFGFETFFLNTKTKEEGKIVFGSGYFGKPEYQRYISHIEPEQEMTDERRNEIELELEPYLNDILNAKEL